MNWPEGKYRVILADPPWAYQNWSDTKQGAAKAIYDTMPHGEIGKLPVAEIADKNCVLLMWATFPKLKEAFEVMADWGFEYKTVAFTWVKVYGTQSVSPNQPYMGLGFWTRGNAEICLLGTRGKPKRKVPDVSQIIMATVRGHSRKPDEQYRRIERLLDGPYCELFARYPRPGWTTWGNENRPRQMDLEEAA